MTLIYRGKNRIYNPELLQYISCEKNNNKVNKSHKKKQVRKWEKESVDGGHCRYRLHNSN